jgi:hypothetical protein
MVLREKMKVEQERLEKLQQKLQAEYAAKQKEIMAKMDRAIFEGSADASIMVKRVFQINKFGIYNSDCRYQGDNSKAIVPIFVDAVTNEKIYGQQLYVYHKSKNVVFNYSTFSKSPQVFFTDAGLQICLVKGTLIYMVNEADYKSGIDNSKSEFKAKLISNEINGLSDLRSIMGI